MRKCFYIKNHYFLQSKPLVVIEKNEKKCWSIVFFRAEMKSQKIPPLSIQKIVWPQKKQPFQKHSVMYDIQKQSILHIKITFFWGISFSCMFAMPRRVKGAPWPPSPFGQIGRFTDLLPNEFQSLGKIKNSLIIIFSGQAPLMALGFANLRSWGFP